MLLILMSANFSCQKIDVQNLVKQIILWRNNWFIVQRVVFIYQSKYWL